MCCECREKLIPNKCLLKTGMDQKKTTIPYDSVEQASAADTSSNRITQSVMGGIVHGIGRFFYVTDGLLFDLKGSDYGKFKSCVLFTMFHMLQW